MPTLLPMTLALLTWADPPPGSAPQLTAQELVAALESAVGDAIARAEPAVVAISREKSENDETTAVRGRDPFPARMVDRRTMPHPFDPVGTETLSFDYGSGVVIGDRGE